MNGKNDVVTLNGNRNKVEAFGIGQFERALSIGIAERMERFHYDELCRIDGVSRIRAVRSDEGRIDVFATFMKIRHARMSSRGGR